MPSVIHTSWLSRKRATPETLYAELSVSQVCTEKVSTWQGGRFRAQGAPLVVSHSRWRENEGGGLLLSLPSSPLRWCEGSCWKQMTYIFFETFSFLQQRGLPGFRKDGVTYGEARKEKRKKKWECLRRYRKTETGTLPVWQGRHEKRDAGRQKETGKSFDGNPPRLFRPSLSSGYRKHI